MRRVVPALAVLATTIGAIAGVALRRDRTPAGPSRVDPGVTRCTSDFRCTFEDANGVLSAPRSTLAPP